MAVTAADLIYPVGEIEEGWFAGQDLPAHLTLWIGQAGAYVPAEATTEQEDGIATAFAYWRAYESKLMALAASPDSAALEGLSRTVKDSRVWFAEKAKAWRAVFDAAVAAALPVEPEPETVSNPPRTSRSVAFTVAF